MVGVGDSLGSEDPWSLSRLTAQAQKFGIEPSIQDENDPLKVALTTGGKLAEIQLLEKQRLEAQQSASMVMGYKPITVAESLSAGNVKTVEVSDIKTAHNFDVKAAPTESTLELKPTSYGSEQLVKIHNRIFDREIIRNETGIVTGLQDKIKLPESNIKLEVSISKEGKTIKIFENGSEEKELNFSIQGKDDKQRIELPSFSEPSLSGDSTASVWFHKKSLSPYKPLTNQGELIEPYELITNKYKLLVDKGIITIRDDQGSLVFLQDGEGRNYIFHPESVSETGLVKSKRELESSISPADSIRILEEEQLQKMDILALFEEKGNPSEMLVRFPETNSEGKTEVMVKKSEIEARLQEIQLSLRGYYGGSTNFLSNHQGHLQGTNQLAKFQKLLGYGSQEAAITTPTEVNEFNILNPNQTVAMFTGTAGDVQYFNGQAKSLYGMTPN